MDQAEIKHHYSQKYNDELEKVRSHVLTMGGLVEQQLARAIKALSNGEVGEAEEVVANDYKVNAYDVDIDEECTNIIALRQPTASDLRLVLTVIKITADLERMGDEAKRVARMAIRVAKSDQSRRLYQQVEHLGELVISMLHSALDTFARLDLEGAVAVAHEDEHVDREYENVARQAMTFMMEDPRSIPFVLDILWAARALERIGDRCCNVSEYVIYLVKGKDVRHTSLDQIKMQLDG